MKSIARGAQDKTASFGHGTTGIQYKSKQSFSQRIRVNRPSMAFTVNLNQNIHSQADGVPQTISKIAEKGQHLHADWLERLSTGERQQIGNKQIAPAKNGRQRVFIEATLTITARARLTNTRKHLIQGRGCPDSHAERRRLN
jgi:hypothetical protein